MTTFTDTNFTYIVLSNTDKTVSIVGVNPTKYPSASTNWGTFPAIPLTYTGTNATYAGYKVTEIGNSAFELKTAFSNTTLTSSFLTTNLTRIGDKAFMGVKLQGTLTIPENIVTIGTMAFYNCTLITNIIIGSITNSDTISHLADLVAVMNQEILDRKNADDSLNLLKAPINNATLTGSATIPVANIANASIANANIFRAVVGNTTMQNATITNKLEVSGNMTFSGNTTTTGQWVFTTQPQYNSKNIATETFVSDQINTVAGPDLSATLTALTGLTTATDADPSFTSNVVNGNTILLNSLTSEISLRGSAVSSLSTALSTVASSLIVKDTSLSTVVSSEVNTCSGSVSSLSTALSTSASSLTVVDSSLSTALSTETSTRISDGVSLSTALSTAASSLVVVDSGISTALSTEISTCASATTSLSKTISTSVSALASTDSSISTGISTEISARSQSISLISSTISSATSSLVAADSARSSSLSTEVSIRGSVLSSLSTSVSGAIVQLQTNNQTMSNAFVNESTALSTAVSSLNVSTSTAASTLTSVNSSIGSAITAEISTRVSAVSSLSLAATDAVTGLVNSNTNLSGAITNEVTVRASQVGSISAVLSVVLPSLTTVASGLSTALSTEISAASTALSMALSNVRGNAPASLDTLAEIASQITANPSLAQIASVMADITTTSNALSAEISNRANAITSVSQALSSGVASLTAVDNSISTALTTEVSTRNASIASVSTSLAGVAAALNTTNGTLAATLNTEVSTRGASITSVGTGLGNASTSLAAVDTALNAALTSENTARVLSLNSFSTSLSTANSSLVSANNLISTGLSTENSARAIALTSVASVLSTSAASMQTEINATSTSLSTVSSEAALKATNTYLSNQISNIIGGAPATLDTLAEIGAALNNQNNFAGSITTALGTKAPAIDVTTLSTTLSQKANQTDYASLSSVVNTKAATTATDNASTIINTLSNTVTTLVADVSSLKVTGGSVNPNSVAVNGISLSDITNWTKEIYIKLGLTNPDGTINEKLNSLTNPSLVSNTLGFEYDGSGAVTKVNHLITVKFDKGQKSVTVTGGVGNPTVTVSNMVLDGSNNYLFTISYVGNVAYYTANKTSVNITALESQYNFAPTVPTVVVSAPDETTYKPATPTVTTPYAATTWDPTTQIITQPITVSTTGTAITLQFSLGGYSTTDITIQAASGATAVSGQTNQFTVSGTSAVFNVKYLRSLVGTGSNAISAKILETSSRLPSNSLTISSVINDVAQYSTPAISGGITYTGTSPGPYTATMSYTVASGISTVGILKTDLSALPNQNYYITNPTNGQTLVNFPTIGPTKTWTFNIPAQLGSVSFINSSNSNNIVLNIDFQSDRVALRQYVGTWGGQSDIMSGFHDLPRPTTFTVRFDGRSFLITYNNTSVSYVNAQSITNITGVNDVPVLTGVTYTGPVTQSLRTTWSMSLAFRITSGGSWSALIGNMRNPIVGADGRGWGLWVSSANNIYFSWDFTTWDTGLSVALNTDYVVTLTSTASSLTAALTNTSASTTSTAVNNSVTSSNQMLANGTVTAGGWINTPNETLPGTISSVYMIPDTTTPSYYMSVSGTTASFGVSFTNAASPLNIVVVTQSDTNGRQGAASASQTLTGLYAAPVLSSITYTGTTPGPYTATMSYTVDPTVTAVSVTKSDLSALPAGATLNTSVSSGNASVVITFTESLSPLDIIVVAQGNSNGRQSVASATQSLLKIYATPTLVPGSKSVSLSGATYTMTAQFNSVATYSTFNTSNTLIPNNPLGWPSAFVLRKSTADWKPLMRQAYPDRSAKTTSNFTYASNYDGISQTYQVWSPDSQFNTSYSGNQISTQFAYFASYWLRRLKIPSNQYLTVPVYTGRNYTYASFYWHHVNVADVFGGNLIFGMEGSTLVCRLSSYDSGTKYTFTIQTDAEATAQAENDTDFGVMRNSGGLPNLMAIHTAADTWKAKAALITADTANLQTWGGVNSGYDTQFYDTTNTPANQIAMQFAYFARYWTTRLNVSDSIVLSVPVIAAQGAVGIFSFYTFSGSIYGGLNTYNSGTWYTLSNQADAVTAAIGSQIIPTVSVTYTSASIGIPLLKIGIPGTATIRASDYLILNGLNGVSGVTLFEYAAPVLSGITYSGTGPYIATMNYTVTSGVTAVSVLKSDLSALPTGASFTNSVTTTTATIQVTFTDAVVPLSIVVIAQGNSNGLDSAPSATQSLTPPPLLSLDANGVTVKYTQATITGDNPQLVQSNVRGTMEWFAVVNNNDVSTSAGFRGIIDFLGQCASGVATSVAKLIPPGQSTPVPLNNIVTTLLTDMNGMFLSRYFTQTIESWDTSNVVSMVQTFRGTTGFNQTLNYWNVSKVSNMSQMFSLNTVYNQPLNNWNTSSVTNMSYMFEYNTAFRQPLNNWNTSNVTNMQWMFSNSNYNQDLRAWNVSKVTAVNRNGFAAQAYSLTYPPTWVLL